MPFSSTGSVKNQVKIVADLEREDLDKNYELEVGKLGQVEEREQRDHPSKNDYVIAYEKLQLSKSENPLQQIMRQYIINHLDGYFARLNTPANRPHNRQRSDLSSSESSKKQKKGDFPKSEIFDEIEEKDLEDDANFPKKISNEYNEDLDAVKNKKIIFVEKPKKFSRIKNFSFRKNIGLKMKSGILNHHRNTPKRSQERKFKTVKFNQKFKTIISDFQSRE